MVTFDAIIIAYRTPVSVTSNQILWLISNNVFLFFITDLYFVVRFKISWQISCANSGLSEVKFLKYSSLIILRLIDWFPNLVTLLLIHVRFAPEVGGIIRYMTGSGVTKTNTIITNVQKIVICLICIHRPISDYEQQIIKYLKLMAPLRVGWL